MNIFIVGHRGTGKSRLLLRIREYFPSDECVDLDNYIESTERLTISEIFLKGGEAEFRHLEKTKLQELISKPSKQRRWIALGAGFHLHEIPNLTGRVLWLRRLSDASGRIFFDRPLIRANSKSSLEDYESVFSSRQENFKKWAQSVLEMPEGVHIIRNANSTWYFAFEKRFLDAVDGTRQTGLRGDLPVICLAKLQAIPSVPATLEIRNDVLPFKAVQDPKLVGRNLLFTVRNSTPEEPPKSHHYDWALELGPPPSDWRAADIISVHTKKNTIEETLDFIGASAHPKSHMKLAIEVADFIELEKGWRWQQQDPERRSFLPRSKDGKWKWFRLFTKGRQKLNFVTNGISDDVPDQPSLWQWEATPNRSTRFAAVLGNPVSHSYSPLFHMEFFARKDMPFWPIAIEQSE